MFMLMFMCMLVHVVVSHGACLGFGSASVVCVCRSLVRICANLSTRRQTLGLVAYDFLMVKETLRACIVGGSASVVGPSRASRRKL